MLFIIHTITYELNFRFWPKADIDPACVNQFLGWVIQRKNHKLNRTL